MSVASTPLIRRFADWQRLSYRYPEWWTVALSAVAWVVIIVRTHSPSLRVSPQLHYHQFATNGAAPHAGVLWVSESIQWMLMVIAMMLPLVTASMRITATRSLWVRRQRAIIFFSLGYLTVWCIAGLMLSLAVAALRLNAWAQVRLAIAAFAGAAAWQLTVWKRCALRACDRTIPIAPCGWPADCDCFRYGRLIGISCLLSCWALMAACSLSGHNIAALGCTTAVAFAERYMIRPDHRIFFAMLLGFAVVLSIVAAAG